MNTIPTPDLNPASVHCWAALFNALRAHFLASGALEVSTPVLSQAGITDPNIHSLSTPVAGSGQRYLHTSPEFAMKRLLAEGSGDIYQICRVFRDAERGRLHCPEFLMCEWYRVGLDHRQLMQETDVLLQRLWQDLATGVAGPLESSLYISYTDAIETVCGARLPELDIPSIRQVLVAGDVHSPLDDNASLDDWLDLLMSTRVFATFPVDRFTFLYDYPASQAALARTGVNESGDAVAHRFEVFHGGIELANGFHELACATEQRHRFELEQQRRRQLGLPVIPVDELLLSALQNGFPDCAGVALGLERLMMVLQATQSIDEVKPLGAGCV